MAYNYYDNFSGRASTTNHGYQTNSLNSKYYYQHPNNGVGGIVNNGVNDSSGRYNHHQQQQPQQQSVQDPTGVQYRNKRNKHNRSTGNVYYPGQEQPVMAMMVVDSSPSSPSSNSQEGGRGYSGIPVGKQHRMQLKKMNLRDKSHSKADSASGEEKSIRSSSKKHVNGIATTEKAKTSRSAANDEEYLTTKKVGLYKVQAVK